MCLCVCFLGDRVLCSFPVVNGSAIFACVCVLVFVCLNRFASVLVLSLCSFRLYGFALFVCVLVLLIC